VKEITLRVVVVVLFLVMGCARVTTYSSKPTMQTGSNEFFEIQLEPQLAEGQIYFDSFHFMFKNKTNKDLIIDWSKTYYIYQGKRYGQFGWKGMTFEELKGIKIQPSVTAPAGSSFTEVIFPLNLIAWDIEGRESIPRKRPEEAFFPGIIPQGENGIYLFVTQDGKEIRERVTLVIEKQTSTK
jgi:hypothetical protein